MKNNKNMFSTLKFRMLWVLAFLVAAPWAVAQKDIPPTGFAGEDRTELHLKDEYKQVTLGLDEYYDNDDSYYEWTLVSAPEDYVEPEGGVIPLSFNQGNIHKHKVIARLKDEGEYRFDVTRISKYGYQTECVTITLRKRPIILSVESLKKCYNVDDEVTIDQFKIETDPPDMVQEKLIEIANPEELNGHFHSVLEGAWLKVPVHFLCKASVNDDNPVVSDKIGIIHVNNKGVASLGYESPAFRDIYKALKGLPKAADAFSNYAKYLSKGKLPFEPVFDGSIDVNYYKKCCNDADRSFFYVGIDIKLGGKLDMPIPVFPGVYIGVNVYGGAVLTIPGAEFAVVSDDIGGVGFECGDLDITLIFQLSGGLTAGVGNPATFGLEAGFEVGGSVGGKYNLKTMNLKWVDPEAYIAIIGVLRTPVGNIPAKLILLHVKKKMS